MRLLAAALWREACCARPEKNRQVAKSAKQSRRVPCLQATKENLPRRSTPNNR